jgi:hypothetical protein
MYRVAADSSPAADINAGMTPAAVEKSDDRAVCFLDSQCATNPEDSPGNISFFHKAHNARQSRPDQTDP